MNDVKVNQKAKGDRISTIALYGCAVTPKHPRLSLTAPRQLGCQPPTACLTNYAAG
jgi:hypothetical protein